MALQVIAVPGAKIGSGTQLGTAIGGLAQIYSNLPAEAKKKIMGWFTDDDEQSEHESAENNASRNSDDWKTAATEVPDKGTPEYAEYQREMAESQMEGYRPEEAGWVVEGE